ncbi:phage major capsid protein [Paenibacillus validus]|uniref:phage major capsid protein n=1 Tax=Paenibacillus validus TaxID=44253 RepID=UPI000FDC3A99|nr:phage major capsid protein [Paenibacillus validus]MED4599877.1 phage major capsid protein [Paenibacillus validus]MED4606090.1 phage major capsid protein [Paenibacillus validus]
MGKLSQKEAAELKREKSELEQKRLALKEKVKNHRDMSTEDITDATEELRSMGERIDEINEQLSNAPEDFKRGPIPQMKTNEINEQNFRSSAKYRDAFYRSFINRSVSTEDAEIMEMGKRSITDMNGGSITSGAAYLVPQTTLDVINSVIVKYGQVYAAITKYGFTGNVSLPIGTAGSPTDNGDGTATLNFTFTEANISQEAIVATIKVKNLLLKNSISALETYLAMEMGKYLGTYLDNAVINGDGGTFTGIIPSITAAPSEKQTYSLMDWAQLMDIESDVDSPYGDDAVFIMRRKTFFNRFRKMSDASGAPITTTIPVITGNGKTQFFLDGHPVIFTTAMQIDDILFGDIKQYVVNESQEITIESSSVGDDVFGKDQTMWRGKVYSGGLPLFAKTTFTYYAYQPTP